MVLSTLSGVISNEKYSDLNYKTLVTKSHDPLSKPLSLCSPKGSQKLRKHRAVFVLAERDGAQLQS